ncbi:unnamed protein product, partial [Prorocentrum cordatum]
ELQRLEEVRDEARDASPRLHAALRCSADRGREPCAAANGVSAHSEHGGIPPGRGECHHDRGPEHHDPALGGRTYARTGTGDAGGAPRQGHARDHDPALGGCSYARAGTGNVGPAPRQGHARGRLSEELERQADLCDDSRGAACGGPAGHAGRGALHRDRKREHHGLRSGEQPDLRNAHGVPPSAAAAPAPARARHERCHSDLLSQGPVPGTNAEGAAAPGTRPPRAARAGGAQPRSGRSPLASRPAGGAAAQALIPAVPPGTWQAVAPPPAAPRRPEALRPPLLAGHPSRADGRAAAAVRTGTAGEAEQAGAGIEASAAAGAEVQVGGLEAASAGTLLWRRRVRGRDRHHLHRQQRQQADEGSGAQVDAGEPVSGFEAGTEVQLGGFEAASAGMLVWRRRVRGRDRRHRHRPSAFSSSSDGGGSGSVSRDSGASGTERQRWADQDFGQNGLVVEDFEEEREEEARLGEIGRTGGAGVGVQETIDADLHGVLDEPVRWR